MKTTRLRISNINNTEFRVNYKNIQFFVNRTADETQIIQYQDRVIGIDFNDMPIIREERMIVAIGHFCNDKTSNKQVAENILRYNYGQKQFKTEDHYNQIVEDYRCY